MSGSFANRGKGLEDLIKYTNTQYKNLGVAKVQKIDTPKQVIRQGGQITGAYYTEKSTLDFLGVIKGGLGVAFDAKQTKQPRFPMSSIKQHQIDFMQDWDSFGGHAFMIIEFTEVGKIFKMDYPYLKNCWDRWKMHKGERGYASLGLDEMELNCLEVKQNRSIALDYLTGLY